MNASVPQFAGLTLIFAASCIACAADIYPVKPIRIIDPYAPGGSTEAQARVIGQKLTERWGQPVVIDGRPGAGSALGTQIAARSTPDGYTLLMNNAAFATVPNLSKSPLVDPEKDFAPVIELGLQPFFLVGHPSLPDTMKDLLGYAKAYPGKLNFGSAGAGGGSHLGMELLKSLAQVNLVHIPYKGSAPAAVAILANEVQLGMFSANSVLAHIKAGRLRVYGVSSARRSMALPDLPTIAEAGVPGFEVQNWSGFFAPARTPRDVVQRLNTEINAILQLPDVKDHFGNLNVEPVGGTPQQFAAFVVVEVRKWGRVIRQAGIRVE